LRYRTLKPDSEGWQGKSGMRLINHNTYLGQITIALMLTVWGGCGRSGSKETLVYEPGIGWTTGEGKQAVNEQPIADVQRESVGRLNLQPEELLRPTENREVKADQQSYYTIQLSVWRSEEEAASAARSYQEHGLEAYVQKVALEGRGIWYRVRVGKYSTLARAEQAARSLGIIPYDQVWVDYYREEGGLP